MIYRRFPLIVILVTSIFVFACGGSNNLQVTVSAQNTKIAELSSGSQPAPTNSIIPNGVTTATLELSSTNTAPAGSFLISDALAVLPIKYTVGEENSASDGFRNVDLQLYIRNISPFIYSSRLEIVSLHAVLTDSNEFTVRCLASNINRIPGGSFPPGFGVPHQLSCSMPNNASVKGFTLTVNGEAIASLTAPPDGNYNEMPSNADLLRDYVLEGNVATIEDFVQFELLSAEFDPEYTTFSPINSAWKISLKVKNLYGASMSYAPLGGIVNSIQVITDSGIYYVEQNTNLPSIPPGEEMTWDFNVLADPSPNSALVIVMTRAYNDPAYSNDRLYTILTLPQP